MRLLSAALFALPAFAFAAGGGDSSPPTATQTTKTCTNGMIWDASLKRCVVPRESSLNDDARYEAVRELAYAGQIDAAQTVLASMSDQNEDRVLTYWGFTHGKKGDLDIALKYYSAALAQNPDNILARSYMGQALVAADRTDEARAQLVEILRRDGGETWAATSLRAALRSGQGYSY